jgi:hypothetical protein
MNDLYQRLTDLSEREKELKCLYEIDQCLAGNDLYLVFKNILTVIPGGWQFPELCSVEISCFDIHLKSSRFESSANYISSEIKSDEKNLGHLRIYYPASVEGKRPAFLPEETLLLNAITRHIAMFLSLPAPEKERKEKPESHWEWRLRMANELCRFTPFHDLRISAIYVAGSTKNATAGPASDIDLIIVHQASDTTAIEAYMRGWSHSLAVWNEARTGIQQPDGLLDLHLLHENELQSENSWATMLRSSENSARLLKSVT